MNIFIEKVQILHGFYFFSYQWRQLTAEQKLGWEEKAAKLTQELKEAQALEDAQNPPGTPIPNPPNLPPNWIFECLWDKCDYQFEDLSDCVDHVCAEPNGHVISYFNTPPPKGQG